LAEIRDVSNDGKIADHDLIHEEVTGYQKEERKNFAGGLRHVSMADQWRIAPKPELGNI